MKKLIAHRLAVLPIILVGISFLVFMLGRLIPGDPAVAFAGGAERADPRVVQQLRDEWGLNEPLPVQYVKYVWQLLQGDLGFSFIQQNSVVHLVRDRAPATIEVTAAALLIGVPVGLALGVSSARRQGSFADHAAKMVAIAGISIPVFWLPLLLAYVFSVRLGWLPLSGRLPAFSAFESRTGIYTIDAIIGGDFGALPDILRHLALPTLTLAVIPAAVMARFSRSIFIDVLSENYIRTAHAYGIPPRTVIWRLAGKNAVLPLITLITLLVPALIVGGVLVENVFSWPGVGQFLLNSLTSRDYIVVQSLTLLVGVLYVVLNLIADLSYAILDPRTRRS